MAGAIPRCSRGDGEDSERAGALTVAECGGKTTADRTGESRMASRATHDGLPDAMLESLRGAPYVSGDRREMGNAGGHMQTSRSSGDRDKSVMRFVKCRIGPSCRNSWTSPRRHRRGQCWWSTIRSCGLPVGAGSSPTGLPVLPRLPSRRHGRRQYPGGSGRCSCRLLSRSATGLPLFNGGSAPATIRFGAGTAFTNVPACLLAEPPEATL